MAHCRSAATTGSAAVASRSAIRASTRRSALTNPITDGTRPASC